MISALLFLIGSGTAVSSGMTVQVAGLPDDYISKVEITLPNGSAEQFDWTSGFVGEIPGEYRVSGETVRIPGEIIDAVYEAAPVSGRLDEGGSASVTLRYSQRPGSGMLWMFTTRTDDEDELTQAHARAFDASALEQGGFTRANRTITLPPRLYGGTALPNGDLLYVDTWDNQSVMRLSKAAQGGSGSAEALAVPRLGFVQLDIRGRLWVAGADFADRYSANAVASGRLGDPEAKFEGNWEQEQHLVMAAFAFDHDGSVVALGNGAIARVPTDLFASSGEKVFPWKPAVQGGVNQVAIDKDGNVWAAYESGVVVRYTKAEVDSSADARGTEYEVEQSACGLAIDNSGGVWVLIRWTGDLYRLEPGGSSFSKVGNVGTGSSESTRLTLNPPPAWSPLAAAPGFPAVAGRKGD